MKKIKWAPFSIGSAVLAAGIYNSLKVRKDIKKLEAGEIKKSELSLFERLAPLYTVIGAITVLYSLSDLSN